MTTQPAQAAVGIRLGISSVTLAICRMGQGFDSRATVVASVGGERTTPAVVGKAANGEWLVGEAARHQAHKNRSGVFIDFFALIGREDFEVEETKALAASLPFGTRVNGDTGAVEIEVRDDEKGQTWTTPTELLGLLLRQLKGLAEEQAGGRVGACVVTVPADMTEFQRGQISVLGSTIGLDVFQVLSEPSAVLLAHGLDQPPRDDQTSHRASQRVLVLDLGASALRLTLLQCERGIISQEAAVTLKTVSGRLFVQRLVDFASKQFKRKTGIVVSESPKAVLKLDKACDNALRVLSKSPQTDLEVESLCEGMDLRLRVSRARFEDLSTDLFKMIDDALDEILQNTKGEIQVLLSGGAARLTKVQALAFSQKRPQVVQTPPADLIKEALVPDEAASLGAAAQAARLVRGEDGSMNLSYKKSKQKLHKTVPEVKEHPCSSMSLTASLSHSSMTPSDAAQPHKATISRGALLPACGTIVLSSDVTGGGPVKISILEVLEDGTTTSLAEMPLDLTPEGDLKVQVDFAMGLDGCVDVHAVEAASGIEGDLSLTVSSE
eukprot:CAMPEP_0185747714 /NCGR_PEP_ID=MMETSP1174-20130828/6344_1 /TAXON_ID=35687 /ORGANISM="Dictyocha speculum, Strain CCMP1381" /LENGTH=551 /DNA_ID=CAMNT_0028423013 /DNA_START=13 /DNA_END=1668 /DNA_ORIENTATION=-